MQGKLVLNPMLFSLACDIKGWGIYFYTMLSVLIREDYFFFPYGTLLIICLYILGLLAGQKRTESILWLGWSGCYFNTSFQITGNSCDFSQHSSKAALQNQVSYCGKGHPCHSHLAAYAPGQLWIVQLSVWTLVMRKELLEILLGISFPWINSQISVRARFLP